MLTALPRLCLTLIPFRRLVKLKLSKIDTMMKLNQEWLRKIETQCEEEFKSKIIYEFRSDGRDWHISVRLPTRGLTDVRGGSLIFTDKEIHDVMLPAVQIVVQHCLSLLSGMSRQIFSVSSTWTMDDAIRRS
jgi:hypothetical protein